MGFVALVEKLKGISLKWKLLIPFLFFAFTGTSSLVLIGLMSQQGLIRDEEEREAFHYYHLFMEEMGLRKNQVLSLATMIAERADVQKLLHDRDREGLRDLMARTFARMKEDFHIGQLHFHIPPGISFLRLHSPSLHGDDLTEDRKSIVDAMRNLEPKAGLERGRTGYGIRGVVPVVKDGRLAGTVEVGHSFGKDYVQELHRRWGLDIALYEWGGKHDWRLLGKASREDRGRFVDPDRVKGGKNRPVFLIGPEGDADRALLLGPVRDYAGRVISLLEISLDRKETQERLARTRDVMIMVGLVAITVSFLLTYLVALFFIHPIKAIVREAQEIAEEKRDTHIEPRSRDEIGTLTEALNVMLDALMSRRMQIERYARTLEKRVEERTADLVASEEKYRTLVENVPLVVYRVLPDGTTEFINSALTDILGYSIEEAVGNREFWCEKIWECERSECEVIWERAFRNGEGRRVERVVKDKAGQALTFIDHSIPTRGPGGKVRWVDGIMMDITELKRFQAEALRTEEIRVLGEISAHMAHAIRNPLSSAGGFARRLRDSLAPHDPQRRLAEIVVREAARIEDFLKVLLSSIRPFELSYGEVDVNEILLGSLKKLESSTKGRQIQVITSLSPTCPKIAADEERLTEALECMLKHAIVITPPGEELRMATARSGERIVVTLQHKAQHLSADDMDKFFFPHIEEQSEWPILDLSLARRVIHRHGGIVEARLEGNAQLTTNIELPIAQAASSSTLG